MYKRQALIVTCFKNNGTNLRLTTVRQIKNTLGLQQSIAEEGNNEAASNRMQ
jgi:hypothetical protein